MLWGMLQTGCRNGKSRWRVCNGQLSPRRADQLPLLNLEDSNNGLSAQLLRVSDELKARGYPLINSVVEEYGHLGKGLEE